ncbi:MAG: chloride channel protein, partial [Bdellovibrionales bacterium]|nr:chloride channel protein [Bdellovibrionales bacterium]
AAFFTAVVRAPLTGVILIVEMTANYNLLFSLLLGCMLAYLISEMAGNKPIYEGLMQLSLKAENPGSLDDSEPVLFDIAVESDSPMDSALVKNLRFPKGCLLIRLKKGGRDTIPSGDTRLEAGDEVTVVVAADIVSSIAQVRELASAQT